MKKIKLNNGFVFLEKLVYQCLQFFVNIDILAFFDL